MYKRLLYSLLLFCASISYGANSTIYNPFTNNLDYVGGSSSATLTGGSTSYIQNSPTLQAGATSYPDFGYFGTSVTIYGNNGFQINPVNNDFSVGTGGGLPPYTGYVGLGITNPTQGWFTVNRYGGSSYGNGGVSLATFLSTHSYGGFTVGAPAFNNSFIEFVQGSTKGGLLGFNYGAYPYNVEIETYGTFQIGSLGLATNYLEILANGNIGIGGVNSPSTLLQVSSGTVTIDGNVSPALQVFGSGAPPDSKALCLLNGQLGHCTTVVGATGGCTCGVP